MKRKLSFGLMMLATLFAASCAKELVEAPVLNEEAKVTFSVNTPEIATRAYSDGTTATVLQYAVYDEEGEILTDLTKTDARINASTTVELQLTTGNTYSVIFWAAAPNAPYTVDFTAKTMTVDYRAAVSNDEARDAFFKKHTFTVTGAQTETIELRRPFAQLNIGTADYTASTNAGYTPTQSSVTVPVYTTLNLASGDVDGQVTKTFALANIKKDETFPVAGNEYLAMNYLLVASDKEVVDVEFTYTDGADAKTRTVGSVPVQRNYRTNIYGNLLTSQVDINVEIKPEYETPDNLVYVWDGTEVSEPNVNDNNIYEIEYASELAWLAAAVNGTLEVAPTTKSAVAPIDFAGKTFVLTKDIDLGGKEWTPIGNSNNIFKGTLDGQGHVVKNLKITGYNSNVGLFGVTHDGEIKNLVVENAEVSGRLNVGVVAGQPYTSKYTDITVKGHVEVNGMSYVGAVGGKNAYADWTDIKVEADATSYVKANSVENGTAYRTYVGGVVGFNGEGTHKFENITSNINVEGTTKDVGGLFGIAHYGNQFVNCVCTGNVTITTDKPENALQMGGIAGVWNNGGEDVVFTNCTFTGELSTRNVTEEVDFYYGGLVGCPYSTDGAGKLFIDGAQYVATSAELQAGANSASENVIIKFGTNLNGNITIVQKEGVDLTINGDDKKYDGIITVDGAGRSSGAEKLTFDNINFETTWSDTDKNNDWSFISAPSKINGQYNYSHNVTIQNCTFNNTVDGNHHVGSASFTGAYNFKMENCTATNMHSILQAQSIDNTVTVKGVTVTESKSGLSVGNTAIATITNANINVSGYGIRAEGTDAREVTLTVTGSTIDAYVPVVVRKLTDVAKKFTVEVDESNALTTGCGYHVVLGQNEFEEGVEPVKPACEFDIDGVAPKFTTFPAEFTVATWDEFTAALAAGEDWIKLTDNISNTSSYTLNQNVTIDLNGKTFELSDADAILYTGDKKGSKPKVTIKNGNINNIVYGLSGTVILTDIVFGGTITKLDAAQGVITTKYADLLAENVKMTNVKVSGTKPRSFSPEGRSSGYLILRDCDFSNSKLDRAYIWTLSGTAHLEITNSKLYSMASNISLGGSYALSNMNLTGLKSGGFTIELNRASTSLTDEDKAILKAIKSNNKGSMRFICSDKEVQNSL